MLRTQSILIGNRQSTTFLLSNGVPQGSCIGPISFLVYISALYYLTDKHNIQIDGYADDNQLRIPCKPTIYSLREHINLLETCINEIRNYMLSEQLKINDENT